MSSKKSVSVRGVKIGGGAPVSIQSMTNADKFVDRKSVV